MWQEVFSLQWHCKAGLTVFMHFYNIYPLVMHGILFKFNSKNNKLQVTGEITLSKLYTIISEICRFRKWTCEMMEKILPYFAIPILSVLTKHIYPKNPLCTWKCHIGTSPQSNIVASIIWICSLILCGAHLVGGGGKVNQITELYSLSIMLWVLSQFAYINLYN